MGSRDPDVSLSCRCCSSQAYWRIRRREGVKVSEKDFIGGLPTPISQTKVDLTSLGYAMVSEAPQARLGISWEPGFSHKDSRFIPSTQSKVLPQAYPGGYKCQDT